jgi:hypothetical protein
MSEERVKTKSSLFSERGTGPIQETTFRRVLQVESDPTSTQSWELTDSSSHDPRVYHGLIATKRNRGVVLHPCLHNEEFIEEAGIVASGVTIRDNPILVGNYMYATSSVQVADWFRQRGDIPYLRTSFPGLEVAQLESWLHNQGEHYADKNFRYLKNPLDSGFSLPTFVRESRELVGLLHHILAYRKSLKGIAKAFRKKSMKEIVRIISDEHLTWAFGILPLISDIQSIIKLCSTYKEILDKLYRGHQRTHVYTRVTLSPETYPLGGSLNEQVLGRYKTVGGNWSVRYGVDLSYSAYLRYYLRAGDILRTPFGSFLGLLDLFGVQLDPGIIYDAIPFSFVVDWFTDLGDNIHALELPLIPVTMTVVGAAHHVRLRISRSWYYDDPVEGRELLYHTDSTKAFLRRDYIPAQLPDKSHLKSLGIDKLLLAYSLIGSRRRR